MKGFSKTFISFYASPKVFAKNTTSSTISHIIKAWWPHSCAMTQTPVQTHPCATQYNDHRIHPSNPEKRSIKLVLYIKMPTIKRSRIKYEVDLIKDLLKQCWGIAFLSWLIEKGGFVCGALVTFIGSLSWLIGPPTPISGWNTKRLFDWRQAYYIFSLFLDHL